MSKNNKKKDFFGRRTAEHNSHCGGMCILFSVIPACEYLLGIQKGTDEYDKIREYVKEPEGKRKNQRTKQRIRERKKRN